MSIVRFVLSKVKNIRNEKQYQDEFAQKYNHLAETINKITDMRLRDHGSILPH